MQANLVTLAYEGHPITIRDDGWFNATESAKLYGKRPIDWLNLPETVRYVTALAARSKVKESHFAQTRRGGRPGEAGTWLHPKLAVRFAQWLNVDFSLWCDEQIDNLIRNKQTWAQQRHAAASGAKMLAMVLEERRKRDGKETAAHHYMNEHLMLNELVTGERKGCDRDSASSDTLDALAKLQIQDSMLILDSIGYGQRKELLQTAVQALPSYKLLPVAQAIPAKQSKKLKVRKAANADKMQ